MIFRQLEAVGSVYVLPISIGNNNDFFFFSMKDSDCTNFIVI